MAGHDVYLAAMLLLLATVGLAGAERMSNDRCQYDLDLEANTIKVQCQGSGASLTVLARDASLAPTPKPGQGYSGQRAGYGSTEGSEDAEQDDLARGDIRVNDAGPLPEVVWNATRVLERLERRLHRHSLSMGNLTALLEQGDRGLRADLDALRSTDPTDPFLRDGLLAAMRNQYNFMRTAILTQNAEVERLLHSMAALIDVTAYGLRSSLKSHTDVMEQLHSLNHTMVMVKQMVTKELKKKKKFERKEKELNKSGPCPHEVAAFGAGESVTVGGKHGAFMKDSAVEDSRTWVMLLRDNTADVLFEYESEVDLEYDVVSRTYHLPYRCQGSGSVVYRGSLYCQEADTRKVIKYYIQKMEVVGEQEVPGTAVPGLGADLVLAVDELGLWALHTNREAAGKLLLTSLSQDTLETRRTWMTSLPRDMAAGMFMVCGVLHATDSATQAPTFVKYTYDTSTRQDRLLEPGALALVSAPRGREPSITQLSYNPAEKRLVAWNNGLVQIFQVFFKRGVWAT